MFKCCPVLLIEPVGEVLRRSQAQRLEARVKELGLKTKSLDSEQQLIKSQQGDFLKQLVERQTAEKKFQRRLHLAWLGGLSPEFRCAE